MKRKSFMRQLIMSYLIIAVLPLTIIMVVYFSNTMKVAGATAKQRLKSATELASSQFDSVLDNMSFLSLNLVSNENFMDAVKNLSKEEDTRYQQEYYSEISSELVNYAICSSAHDVTFFNDQGYMATSHAYNSGYNYTYRLQKEQMKEISWYKDVQDNFGQEIIIPLQKNQIPKSEKESLTLVRAIRDPGKIIGYLCVEIGKDEISYLLKIDETMTTELIVTRDDGTILYGSEGFPLNKEKEILEDADLEKIEQEYFLSQQKTDSGVAVYMIMAKNIAYADAWNSIEMLILQTAILLCLTLLIIIVFSKDLSKPLLALQEEMKETTIENLLYQGDAKIFNRFEEIAYLYQQFYEMRERLNVMIQREMENQKMYLEERINYLQTQINPHFMCNTLNVIGIMGIENGVQQVHDACLQLSALLRYSIAEKSDRHSTIGAEMKNIQDYLELMKLRYEHKLEYTVFYEKTMSDIVIPRLILEPFVENIFVHAYSNKHKTVRVNVTGYIQNQKWYIVIEDNGQGMNQQQLYQLRKHIDEISEKLLLGKKNNKSYGIGIENTIMRLLLYYNGEFEYELRSGEDHGFQIRLSAGIKRNEKDGTDESDYSRG